MGFGDLQTHFPLLLTCHDNIQEVLNVNCQTAKLLYMQRGED